MKTSTALASWIACAMLAFHSASAAPITLAEYTFHDGTANTSNATAVANGVSAAAVLVGQGVTDMGYSASPVFRIGQHLNSFNTAATIDDGPDLQDYFGFSIQPVAGSLSLSEIRFTQMSFHSNGPRRYQARYSLSGFASDNGTAFASGTVGLTAAESVTDLSAVSALQNVSGAVAVRIYLWGATSATRNGGIDDVRVSGSLPPSATVVLLR